MMKTETIKRRTIVFDLDGSLETPYYDEKKSPSVKAWMEAHPTGCVFDRMLVTIEACGQRLPHFILPGAVELLRWVHDHGFEIVFFSNAVAERNQVLCPILMELAFGRENVPSYRILSREDCVNTQYIHSEEKQALYQGLWHGNYKKKLAGVVVPEADLPNTIMIEDDYSYACKGEEQNFVYGVYGGCAANYLDGMRLSSGAGQDFHLPFYFCGMLKRIVGVSEGSGVSLAEASRQVQYEDYGRLFPTDGVRRRNMSGSILDIPCPPTKDYRVYLEGLNELRAYNPDLRFWQEGEEEKYNWPYVPEKPLPPPEPPKPKAKTDMTMDEANYWMGVLREVLCAAACTNVKHVALRCKDWRNSPSAGESRWTKFRNPKFNEDGDYFDVKEVTGFYAYGYLPIRRDKSEHSRGFQCLEADEGTVKYEVFGNIIRRFLREVFDLEIDWWENEITSCGECWSVPVSR